MDVEIKSQVEIDEENLTFDLPDDALERAGSAAQKAFTLFYCTNSRYDCGLPQ